MFFVSLGPRQEGRGMTLAENSVPEDLEIARQRFVAFHSTHPVGSRLPEALWNVTAELVQPQFRVRKESHPLTGVE